MGDANKSLHGHCGTQKKRAQTIEHHGHAHEVAEVTVRVQVHPVEACNVERDHNGSSDQQAHEVSHHQAAQEQKKGRARAAVCLPKGLDQHHKGKQIGAEAQQTEHNREVGRSDGVCDCEWGSVNGKAEGLV